MSLFFVIAFFFLLPIQVEISTEIEGNKQQDMQKRYKQLQP